MLYLETKRCKPRFSVERDGDCRDFPLSRCLLIKSSPLNYVPCCRCGGFNLSELISPDTTWERDVAQKLWRSRRSRKCNTRTLNGHLPMEISARCCFRPGHRVISNIRLTLVIYSGNTRGFFGARGAARSPMSAKSVARN